jgi:protein O-mannosyl-transferase
MCINRWMRRRWVIFAVLFGAALLAYHNCFNAPFVFDDLPHIVDNARIRSLWPVWPLLSETSRPLVQLSLALNYAISGLHPWSYHVFNVLVHLAAACVLTALVRRTLAAYAPERVRNSANSLALTIGLLWLLHPLQTNSVTYIIQRGESLMALFCLLALYCFVRSVESRHSARWQAVSVFCCVLGLASKPIMVVAPVLVLLYDRTFVSQSFAAALRARARYYAALFATLALLPLLLAGKTADWAPTAGFANVVVTPLQYAGTQPLALLHYLRLAFWPDALCLDYGWRPLDNTAVIAASSLALAALVCAAIMWSRRNRLVAFAAGWFAVTLAPTSSFLPIADLVFEHRMYLALAALISVTVVAAFVFILNCAERLPVLRARQHVILPALAAIVALLLCGRTVLRNDEYASDIALWSSAIEVSPESPRAQYNLGTALMRRNRPAEAAVHLAEAVKLRPGYADALYNLGNAQMAQGNLEEAMLSYRRALSVTPDDWQMHNNLGVAMLRAGDVVAAAYEFERTLQLNPDCTSARSNLERVRNTRPPIL